MRRVFADTHYWVALNHPRDPGKAVARRARAALGNVQIVTTDEVLAEFLTGMSTLPSLRAQATQTVRAILDDSDTLILAQSRQSFLDGLALYEERLDKQYSLVDCISMQVMRGLGISEVLTHDHHFTQEGFTVLITKQS